MLHFKATTRHILTRLASVIELLFSIRQGDPLAMILYVIYIEPLLVALEAELSGFKMGRLVRTEACSFQPWVQKTEAFCDDVNLVTNNDNDFVVANEVIEKFENSSGAIHIVQK